MRWVVALSLASLCLLAVVTVRLRAAEARTAYRVAELERVERLLIDRLIALDTAAAARTSLDSLLRRAVEMRILLELDSGGEDGVALLDVPSEEAYAD